MSFQEDRVRVRQNKLQGLMSFPSFLSQRYMGICFSSKGGFSSPVLLTCVGELTSAFLARPLWLTRLLSSLLFLLFSQSASWALTLAPLGSTFLFVQPLFLPDDLCFFSFCSYQHSLSFFHFLFFIYPDLMLHHFHIHSLPSFDAVRTLLVSLGPAV